MSTAPLDTNTFASVTADAIAAGSNDTRLTVTTGGSGKVGFSLAHVKDGAAETSEGADDATVAVTDTSNAAREYRVMYTDSSLYTSTYSAQNGVFLKKFKINNLKLFSADAVFSDLSMVTDSGEITGSINGLRNGAGYGFKFSDITTPTSPVVSQVGIGNVGRVIVHNGPIAPADNFKVVIKPVANDATNLLALVTINLANSAGVAHSTGRSSDVEKVNLVVTNMNTLESAMLTFTLDAAQQLLGGPIVLESEQTFPSNVKLSAFEYALATIDKTDMISEYASTIHASSVSTRASNVQDILLDGSSNSGTEMKITWKAPAFSGAPITGYRVYYQEQPANKADWNAADVSGVTTAGDKHWYWNIDRATQGATVLAGATKEATITGLTNQSKYMAWVRAVHPTIDSVTGVTMLGNIGNADLFAAPTVSSTQDGTWGGYFPDLSLDDNSVYNADNYFTFTQPTTAIDHKAADGTTSTTQEFTDILRGKPRAINIATNTRMTLHSGIDISSGTPTSADMRKGLAIKWSDDDLDFGGDNTGKNLMYFITHDGEFTETELANVPDASFNAITLATGSAIGSGNFAGDDTTRYVLFNGTNAAGTSVRSTVNPVLYAKDATTGAHSSTTKAAGVGLDLGEKYTFIVALKNTTGLGARTRLGADGKKVVGPPLTQKFNIPWSIADRDDTALDADYGLDLGASRDMSNCLFDVASQSFQITIADDLSGNQKDIQATGAMDDVSYEVKVVPNFGDMTTIAKTDLCLNAVGDISDAFFPLVKNINSDGSIRLSFDSVQTKNSADSFTDQTNNSYPFVTRKISTMKGMKYTITIRAKNSNGPDTSSGTSDSVVASARQVFGTKAAYELLVPKVDISLSGTETDDVLFDATTKDATIMFSMRDLSGAEAGGRRVDEVRYKIYQTLNNGTENILLEDKFDRTDALTGALMTQNIDSTEVTGGVTMKIPASDYEYGYPIKAEIRYASLAAADLAVTPAAAGALSKSAEEYQTAIKHLTFAKIPEDTHDEVGSMGVTEGDKKITVYWSRPGDRYNNLLTGYHVALYDISSGTVTHTNVTNYSSPATVIHAPHLDTSKTSYEFTGLENGKTYMPVVHTLTTQGTVSVKSSGRSLKTKIDNAEVIRQGYNADFGQYVYFGTLVGAANAVNVFDPTACAKPYGIPLVTANVANQELKIDTNGATILYGAMIQVQTAATTTTLARASQTGGVATPNTNVFFLDLSLSGVAGAHSAYKSGDEVYPNRLTYSIQKTFLGEGWTKETNYVFVSNKAGTTAGKIESQVHTTLTHSPL